MKSIQITAVILWGIIFMAVAFILGQILVSKDVFDITGIFTVDKDKQNTLNNSGMINETEKDVITDKIGQETVRIGQNIAIDYFSEYYEAYIDYIMSDTDVYEVNEKITITDELASDYIFYAIAREVDDDKYKSEELDNKILISEGNVNSFIDKMFGKEISEKYKKSNANGYDKKTKQYNIQKIEEYDEYSQELLSIENITSNQVKLGFSCKKKTLKGNKYVSTETKQVNIYAVYRGGRYILTEIEKIEKE